MKTTTRWKTRREISSPRRACAPSSLPPFALLLLTFLPLVQITVLARTEGRVFGVRRATTTAARPPQKCNSKYDSLARANLPLRPPRGGGDGGISIPRAARKTVDVVIGIDGGTESIRACCFDARTGRVVGRSHAVPYATSHPQAGWAEQNPEDWYENLCDAVRGTLATLGREEEEEYDVKALCCDTTCCSVVALSSSHEPLRPCLLWMDARSASQAAKIMDAARSRAKSDGKSVVEAFPELRVNCMGEGPISAEWLLPKAMWIKEKEPEVWADAEIICEYQDYINHRLTGRMVASGCNAAARWHHDGREALGQDEGNQNRGRPMGLYEALGMEDLAGKLPRRTLAMGDVVGGLTEEAAGDLGLPAGTKVVQGGPDAFVGMIGLGTVQPRQMCLITGSSHLHCLVSSSATSAPGTWGAYAGAPLPHLNFAEGGQSSTGSLARWIRNLVSGDGGEEVSYRVLDEEASEVAPGCDGLVALETWQGSRTPDTDPLARGAFVGLTLSHTRAHVFRAILESVCYGTRACFDALEAAAEGADRGCEESSEVVIAGGATRSVLWLQLHADVTGRTFLLNENTDGPLLGCAILASVGAGIHGSVDEAVERMVRRERRIEPRANAKKVYDRLYEEVYLKVRPGVKNVFQALAETRGGASSLASEEREVIGSNGEPMKCSIQHDNGTKHVKRGLLNNLRDRSVESSQLQQNDALPRNAPVIVSPSLLASDWSDMKGEVQKCLDVGLPWLHVDVFDGVFIDSPNALTFGPQMIDSLRRRFTDRHPELTLDVHLCVDRPERYAQPLADAGATRLIFQWEAMTVGDGDEGAALISAVAFARTVTSLGMKCGVSINPETPVASILPLLDSGLVDLVDILAVEPGFGGQEFNEVAIPKIAMLRRYRDEKKLQSGGGTEDVYIKILVDGGINRGTSLLVKSAGADILVAGTALFRHPMGFKEAVKELL